jgi:hypothetical protein
MNTVLSCCALKLLSKYNSPASIIPELEGLRENRNIEGLRESRNTYQITLTIVLLGGGDAFMRLDLLEGLQSLWK